MRNNGIGMSAVCEAMHASSDRVSGKHVRKIKCSTALFAVVSRDGPFRFIFALRNLIQCEPRATHMTPTKRSGPHWPGKDAAGCV